MHLCTWRSFTKCTYTFINPLPDAFFMFNHPLPDNLVHKPRDECSTSYTPVCGRVSSDVTISVLYAEPLRVLRVSDQSKHLYNRDTVQSPSMEQVMVETETNTLKQGPKNITRSSASDWSKPDQATIHLSPITEVVQYSRKPRLHCTQTGLKPVWPNQFELSQIYFW